MHLAALLAGLSPILSKQPLPKDQQLRGEVLDAIGERLGAANFLVFGTGYDSPTWMKANEHGRTYFIEDSRGWVDQQPRSVRAATAMVSYTSQVRSAEADLHDEAALARLLGRMPSKLRALAWDQILVDGPEGWNPSAPGRGQSIYAASQLAGPKTVIFLDDCQRSVEAMYMNFWLLRRGRKLTTYDNGHGGQTCRIGPEEP
mmetsp:Transcript_102749/g.299714  ORF Transcript_102749/g.299714 Transcript_102749/m.299714 type:complete len:202 (-) Transcript_102749:20-625(-)